MLSTDHWKMQSKSHWTRPNIFLFNDNIFIRKWSHLDFKALTILQCSDWRTKGYLIRNSWCVIWNISFNTFKHSKPSWTHRWRHVLTLKTKFQRINFADSICVFRCHCMISAWVKYVKSELPLKEGPIGIKFEVQLKAIKE